MFETRPNAITSECDAFFALANTWKKLAAELEADQSAIERLAGLVRNRRVRFGSKADIPDQIAMSA